MFMPTTFLIRDCCDIFNIFNGKLKKKNAKLKLQPFKLHIYFIRTINVRSKYHRC